MSELTDAVHALSTRVAELEDRATIAALIASYGPAVDSGSAAAAAEIWTDDGRYDAGIVAFDGAAGIAEMVSTEPHQGIIAGGAAHIVTPPVIELAGDHAVAICYQLVLLHDTTGDGFRIWRVSANRWEWLRTPSGWKVTHRSNRLLDGSEEARFLLGSAFEADG